MLRLAVPLGVFAVLLGCAVPRSAGQVRDFSGPPRLLWQPSFRLGSSLARRVDFDGFADPKLTLENALEALAKRYDLVIILDPRAFQQAGCPDALKERVALTPIPAMKDVPAATVLRAILARVPSASEATYILRPDLVEITTHRQAAIEGWEGIGVLLEDSRQRLRYLEYRIRFEILGGEDFHWSYVRGCLEDVTDLCRNLGEMNYWRGVMNENARAALVEAPLQAPARRQP